jgi:RNA polymerase sigma-70 factor, ECF subfamily
MVREHEQALDLAQEALLGAYRGLVSFEGRSGFASWLFVIARNCCLAVLRLHGDGARPRWSGS